MVGGTSTWILLVVVAISSNSSKESLLLSWLKPFPYKIASIIYSRFTYDSVE